MGRRCPGGSAADEREMEGRRFSEIKNECVLEEHRRVFLFSSKQMFFLSLLISAIGFIFATCQTSMK